jgi:hypothetical protein
MLYNTKLRSSEHQKKLKSSPCPDHDPALYGAGGWAQQVLGNRRQRRALGRAQTRAAKSCGVRGIFKVKNHFPALFGCFNLSATYYKSITRGIEESLNF